MTTTTLPAQASVSTPSGWTVTVTHAGTFDVFGRFHAWRTQVTGPDGLARLDALGIRTDDNGGEPDPMLALEAVARAFTDTDSPIGEHLYPETVAALADAIATMWGE